MPTTTTAPRPRFSKKTNWQFPIFAISMSLLAFFLYKNQPPNTLVQTRHFGAVDVSNINTAEAKKIQQVFISIHNVDSTIFIKEIYTQDDMQKLSRVLTEKGSLLDFDLLSWVIAFLDRCPEGLRNLILSKVCETIPQLNICWAMNLKKEGNGNFKGSL